MAVDTFQLDRDLVILFPQYADGTFVLGSSLLGGSDTLGLSSIPAGAFIIGQSLLGGSDLLYDNIQTYKSLSCEASRISISSGFDLQSRALAQPTVGTMDITVQGSTIDPILNAQAHPGAIVIVGAVPKPDTQPYTSGIANIEIVQAGVIESIFSNYDPDSRTNISIQAIDALKFVTNARIGSMSRSVEDYFTRMNFLIQSALTGVQATWRYPEVTPYLAAAPSADSSTANFPAITDTEVAVIDLVQECLDGENGYIWGGADLSIIYDGKNRADRLSNPVLTLTNGAENYPAVVAYSDINIGYDANFSPNSVKAVLASDGVTHVVKSNQDSIDLIGKFQLDVTANVASSSDLTKLVDSVVLNQPGIHAKSVTVPAFDRAGHRLMNHANVGDAVTVIYNQGAINYSENLMVHRIEHEISPENWLITYQLFKPI